MRLVFCIAVCVLMLYVLVFTMRQRESVVEERNKGSKRKGNSFRLEKLRKAYRGRRKDVACAAPRWATATGSYMLRCTLLALQMNTYGSGRVRITATTFEDIENDDETVYDATIAIKVCQRVATSGASCVEMMMMMDREEEKNMCTLCCSFHLCFANALT